MKIGVSLGSPNHFPIVDTVCKKLKDLGHDVLPAGTLSGQPMDYISASVDLAEKLQKKVCKQGILFCMTGTGVSIIANKQKGIRAAFCLDPFGIRVAKLANNANVLIISIRYTTEKIAEDLIEAWFSCESEEIPSHWQDFHLRTEELEKKVFRSQQ